MRNSIRRRCRVIIALAAMLPLPANALQSRLGVALVDTATLVPQNIPQNSNNFASPTSLCASSHDNDGECNYESNTFPFATRRSVISQTARAMFLGTVVISCASLSTIASAEGSDELYLAQPLGPPGADGTSTRPSAPLEYLLPATRVGIYIYQTLAAAEDIARLQKSGDHTSEKNQDAFSTLDSLVLSPPRFIKPDDRTIPKCRGGMHTKPRRSLVKLAWPPRNVKNVASNQSRPISFPSCSSRKFRMPGDLFF